MERFPAVMLLAFSALVAVAGCSKGGQTDSNATETPAPQENAVASASPAAAPTLTVAFSDINGNDAQQAITDEAALGILDSSSGEFKPGAPISRAQFVRWLVKANNVYVKDDASKRIRLAHNGQQFADVPPSNPDFPYIQGLANAGYVIGIDKKHFAPTRPLTREQFIAIKAPFDEGGDIAPKTGLQMYVHVSDVNQINPRYITAIYEDDSVRTTQNRTRIWGPQKTFHPQMPVTRGEAAIAIWEVAAGSAPVALGRTAPPPPK